MGGGGGGRTIDPCPHPAPAGVWGSGCKLLHRVYRRAHYIVLRHQPIFQQVKECMEALVLQYMYTDKAHHIEV